MEKEKDRRFSACPKILRHNVRAVYPESQVLHYK